MKRYRVPYEDYDCGPNLLAMVFSPDADQGAIENQRRAQTDLLARFGTQDGEEKLARTLRLGPSPFSIVAYHNRLLRQVRDAYVSGAFYPALTGCCSLAERVLNHLVLELRDHFRGTPEYKKVQRKKSFDSWDLPIDTLAAWEVFGDEVANAFRELRKLRNDSVHFRATTETESPEMALTAIQTLSRIVELQFGARGPLPWFIGGVADGTPFIAKAAESQPFIAVVYLPRCWLVGPYHELRFSEGRSEVATDPICHPPEGTDSEFAAVYNAARSRQPPSLSL